jgi:hypothetical protein
MQEEAARGKDRAKVRGGDGALVTHGLGLVAVLLVVF